MFFKNCYFYLFVKREILEFYFLSANCVCKWCIQSRDYRLALIWEPCFFVSLFSFNPFPCTNGSDNVWKRKLTLHHNLFSISDFYLVHGIQVEFPSGFYMAHILTIEVSSAHADDFRGHCQACLWLISHNCICHFGLRLEGLSHVETKICACSLNYHGQTCGGWSVKQSTFSICFQKWLFCFGPTTFVRLIQQ